MQLLEWARLRPMVAAAVAGAVLGALLGFAWPILVPPASSAPADDWQLPGDLTAAKGDDKEFGVVRDAPIWGTTGSGLNAEAPDKKTLWRLTGIIADPAPAALVILEGTAEVKRLPVGASLPDGGVIKTVSASSVVFERGGCVYERLLYGPVLPEENAPCDPGAKSAK